MTKLFNIVRQSSFLSLDSNYITIEAPKKAAITEHITKTLYNFDPLNPTFISKTWVYRDIHSFSYFCSKTKIMVLGDSNEYHNLHVCFEQKYEKYQNVLSEKFHFLVEKFSVYLNRRVFVMAILRN